MAHREENKAQIIKELFRTVVEAIIELKEGDEASIAQLVGEWNRGQGYEFKHIDIHHGYVWTKDGGATFAIEDRDQFDILNQVTDMLKGKRKLDFSKYDGMVVGLPYNLHFIVREVNGIF